VATAVLAGRAPHVAAEVSKVNRLKERLSLVHAACGCEQPSSQVFVRGNRISTLVMAARRQRLLPTAAYGSFKINPAADLGAVRLCLRTEWFGLPVLAGKHAAL